MEYVCSEALRAPIAATGATFRDVDFVVVPRAAGDVSSAREMIVARQSCWCRRVRRHNMNLPTNYGNKLAELG